MAIPKACWAVNQIRRLSNCTQVIAGNVATGDGARALIDARQDVPATAAAGR